MPGFNPPKWPERAVRALKQGRRRPDSATRLTFDPGLDQYPVWTPDSLRLIFSSARSAAQNIFWQAADGTGTVEQLTNLPNPQFPDSISPDGKRLVLRETTPTTGNDLTTLVLDTPSGAATAKRQTQPLVHTAFNDWNGEISPDGRWLAYESNESGQPQIYVRPFPNVDTGKWQISTASGTKPLWARSGRELFFLDASDRLTVVPVQTSPAFSAGNPAKLFDTAYFAGGGLSGRTYDVSPDGKRFLMIKDARDADPRSTTAPASIVVVLNWLEELKARLPLK